MSKYKSIVAILLLLCMVFALAACNRGPEYTLEETLQKGHDMLQFTEGINRTYKLTIDKKDTDTQYVITGTSSGTAAKFSLAITEKGLSETYTDIAAVKDKTLYINMDNALSLAEKMSQGDFRFSDTVDLYGKWLVIENGDAYLRDLTNKMRTNIFDGFEENRNTLTSVRGNYTFNYSLEHENAAAIGKDISDKAAAYAGTLQNDIEADIAAIATGKSDEYRKIMAYLQNAVDIDTGKEIEKYVLVGELFKTKLTEWFADFAAMMAEGDSYIQEGITYGVAEKPVFKYRIATYNKDKKEQLAVILEVREVADEQDVAFKDKLIDAPLFIDKLLVNVKNAKGVGYESDDFPYDVTYDMMSLTATEKNDMYNATYTFEFSGKVISKYTVKFMTYNSKIHEALRHKYEELGYITKTDYTDTLMYTDDTSGVLEMSTDRIPSAYSSAKNPVELYDILKQKGLPSYEQ